MEKKYYHTKESVDEYIKLAEGYNGHALIKKLGKLLSTNSSILEIGSGPGSDWKLLDQLYRVVGSDNSKEFIQHLHTEFPKGEFLKLDAVTLDTDQKFDGIYSNKVLHHLTDEELSRSIKRQQVLVNDGGIICHSFWKGEGSEVFKGLFVNYHLKENLRKYFSNYFNILTLDDYKEFEANDSILLIAQKKKGL